MYMDRKGQVNKNKLTVKKMNRVLSILVFGQYVHIPIQRFYGFMVVFTLILELLGYSSLFCLIFQNILFLYFI